MKSTFYVAKWRLIPSLLAFIVIAALCVAMIGAGLTGSAGNPMASMVMGGLGLTFSSAIVALCVLGLVRPLTTIETDGFCSRLGTLSKPSVFRFGDIEKVILGSAPSGVESIAAGSPVIIVKFRPDASAAQDIPAFSKRDNVAYIGLSLYSNGDRLELFYALVSALKDVKPAESTPEAQKTDSPPQSRTKKAATLTIDYDKEEVCVDGVAIPFAQVSGYEFCHSYSWSHDHPQDPDARTHDATEWELMAVSGELQELPGGDADEDTSRSYDSDDDCIYEEWGHERDLYLHCTSAQEYDTLHFCGPKAVEARKLLKPLIKKLRN